MIASKNIYVRVATLICFSISLIFLLEFYLLPPKISTDIFDRNYDFYTHSGNSHYNTKILFTTSGKKYILPESFYFPLVTGDAVTLYKSYLFSWPLHLRIKDYYIPIGIFCDSTSNAQLLAGISLFFFIYCMFFLFRKKIELNDLLAKWLISIPLVLLLMLLYLCIFQTYFI